MKLQNHMRAIIAAGAIAACAVGNAAAQEANSSSVAQEGTGNGAAIVQNGAGNTAGIRQYGHGNTGTITQNGLNSSACLIQAGRGLDGAIVQNGDNQRTGLIQTRHGTHPIPPAFCSTNRRSFSIGAARQAIRRLARRPQQVVAASATPSAFGQ